MIPVSITLRPAREEDAPRMAVLSEQLGYPASAETIRDRLRLLTSREDQQVLVALKDGLVVGWIQVGHQLSLESGAQAEILGLVVDEGIRGQGIGPALVAAAETWARSRGLAILRVRSNLIREATRRFYLGLGFEEVKRQAVFRRAL
jgi:GNAT superfamily N-acetyltransferase